MKQNDFTNGRQWGFTLIELLVAIGVITLLVAVLLPALSVAREAGRSASCGSNLRSIGQTLVTYFDETQGNRYPPSYVFAADAEGNWDTANQPHTSGTPAYGYVHWSWMLAKNRKIPNDTFQCPSVRNGGHPRTNPGPDADHWEARQVDDAGDVCGNSKRPADKQVPRLAYTANGAIMPRNKFTPELAGGGLRVNRLVSQNEIESPGTTILITEFNRNWKAAAEFQSNGYVSLSHRPISPFVSESKETEEGIYHLSPANSDFRYGNGMKNYGLLYGGEAESKIELITGKNGPEVNGIGRHHPIGNDFGGEANYLYCDGRVDHKPVNETLTGREWGSCFYSLTGNSEIKN